MAPPLSRAIAAAIATFAAAAMLAGPASLAGPADRGRESPAPPGAASTRIVATTTQCADLAREVCRGIDGLAVDGLMHAGVDPHIWRPTVSDVRMLAGADAVVCNGLMLEGRMSDVFPKLARRGTRVVELATAVPMDRLIAEGDGHAAADPHVWMDPSIWASAAHALADALAALRPGDAVALRANAGRFASRCSSVAESIELAVATVPPGARLMVTAHDAFRYFGRAFGIEVRGVQGVSTESQAGLADMKALADAIIDRRVPAVFVETSVPDRAVAALIESTALRGHVLRIGGSLYSDAMGEAGTPASRWDGMMIHNARTIVEALGGDASSIAPEVTVPAEAAP
jgi:manganese/zinc/iron transport system substrate-binding protein